MVERSKQICGEIGGEREVIEIAKVEQCTDTCVEPSITVRPAKPSLV